MLNSRASIAQRNITALAVFALFRGTSVSIFRTLFPLYMIDLGYQVADVGTIATLSSIPCIVLLPLIGILIDRIGRKPIATLTGLTMVLALLTLSFTSLYPLLVLAYAFYFFSFIAGQPSRSALLADSIDEQLGTAFTKTFIPFHIARTIVPFFAGYLAEIYGYGPIFLYSSFFVAAGTTFFAFYSVEPARRKKEKISLMKELKESLILERNLLRVYLFAIIDRFAWQLWFPLLNAHFKKGLEMSDSEVGLLSSVMSGTLFTTALFSGKIVDRIGSIKSLCISEALGILTALSLIVIPSKFFAVIPQILVGLSFSLWIPAYNVMIANYSSQEKRGKAYSKMNVFRTAISIPAPQIGGYFYDAIWFATPFLLSIVLMVTNISIIWYRKRRKS
ncbi:MAG: MFS transporter [archaeon GB-1867-005]|nr:MFS transporter [Candidatus Culexmicrobium cathedralense]